MIEIKRENKKHLIIEDANTVKEATEYAVNNYISLEGAELSGADVSGAN